MFRNSLSPLACPFHSLSLTPAPLRRGIRYVTRFSPLLPEEVCICTTPCIAQSQGRLVGEPTRATIPRRRESRLPFILFPLLLFFFFFFFFFVPPSERFFVYDTRVENVARRRSYVAKRILVTRYRKKKGGERKREEYNRGDPILPT